MATQRPPRGPSDKNSRPGRPSGPPRPPGSGRNGPAADRPKRTTRPRPYGPRLAKIEGESEGSDGGLDRIQKILAHAGIGSRRACEELILQGRVSVNGKVVRELGTKVRPNVDSVELDGQKVKAEKLVYIAVNKPKGYVSTTSDPAGRPRVVDLVPEIPERVYTVGRLDESSVGLMLLTNDGELANKLAHPKFGVEKIYRVVVAGHPEREVLDKLVEGVWLAEGKVRAKQVRAVGKRGESTILEMVLAEGKNREVRRMLAKFGHKVMSLTRVAIGPISIQTLKPGHFRFLSPYEVDLLHKVAAGISVPTTHRMPKIPVREGRTSRPAIRRESEAPSGPSAPDFPACRTSIAIDGRGSIDPPSLRRSGTPGRLVSTAARRSGSVGNGPATAGIVRIRASTRFASILPAGRWQWSSEWTVSTTARGTGSVLRSRSATGAGVCIGAATFGSGKWTSTGSWRTLRAETTWPVESGSSAVEAPAPTSDRGAGPSGDRDGVGNRPACRRSSRSTPCPTPTALPAEADAASSAKQAGRG